MKSKCDYWKDGYNRGKQVGRGSLCAQLKELICSLRGIAVWNDDLNTMAEKNHFIAMAQWRGDVAIARKAITDFRDFMLKGEGLTPLYRDKEHRITTIPPQPNDLYEDYAGFRAPINFVYKEV